MEHHYEKVEDILVHEGDDYAKFMGSVAPPIYQSSLFVRPTTANGIPEHPYAYTRASNPTIEAVEKKIAALEGAEAALCFSSGMAAITSAIMHFVEKDCHVITVKSIYGPARNFLNSYLPKKFGVKTSFLSCEEMEHIEDFITEDTRLIYLESPSSGVFRLQDLEYIAKLAKEHGIGTVIDNTYATSLYQHPLEYGIDISVHTASKYLGGHSDLVAGAVISSKEICQQIQNNERVLYGACIDPHQAWLLQRGMRTMKIRLEQHAKNALVVAQYLKNHPYVKEVYYPGLKEGPQKDLIEKYLKGFNGLMSFVIDGDTDAAKKFLDSVNVFLNGCSWGGYESLAVSYTVGYSQESCDATDCPVNLIRLHVGLENVDTLIADLEQALEKTRE